MCNLYLMYYTDAGKASEVARNCMDETTQAISKGLPEDSDKALPPNPILEEMAKHKVLHYVAHLLNSKYYVPSIQKKSSSCSV